MSWKETAETSGSAGRWSYETIQQTKRNWMLDSSQIKEAMNLATAGKAMVRTSRTMTVMMTVPTASPIPPVPKKNTASHHAKENTVNNGSKRVTSIAEHKQLHHKQEEKVHDCLDDAALALEQVAEQDRDPSDVLRNDLDEG